MTSFGTNDAFDTVIDAIRRERTYQDAKYGARRNMPMSKWLDIVMCELMESVTADNYDDERRELLQVAAACIACLEMHGAVERNDAPPLFVGEEKAPDPKDHRVFDVAPDSIRSAVVLTGLYYRTLRTAWGTDDEGVDRRVAKTGQRIESVAHAVLSGAYVTHTGLVIE